MNGDIITDRDVWRHLYEGGSLEELTRGKSKHFTEWARKLERRMRNEAEDIKLSALRQFAAASQEVKEMLNPAEREDWAFVIHRHMVNVNLGYLLLDNRPLDKFVWRKLRPHKARPYLPPYKLSKKHVKEAQS